MRRFKPGILGEKMTYAPYVGVRSDGLRNIMEIKLNC
jgi:hypothetical protein